MQPTNNQSVFKSDTRIFSNNHSALNFTERALKCQRTSAVELTVAFIINSFNTRAAILTGPGGTQARQADKLPPNVSTPFRGYTRVGFTYGTCTTAFSNTWRERPFAVMKKWSDKGLSKNDIWYLVTLLTRIIGPHCVHGYTNKAFLTIS